MVVFFFFFLNGLLARLNDVLFADSSEDDEREDDEPELYENLKHHRKYTALANQVRPSSRNSTYTEVRKSPYYYSDLLKRSQSEEQPDRRHDSGLYRKCQSLDVHGKRGKELKYRETPVNSFDIQEEDEEEEDMATKQRHLYETAFDSKICRSSETLDLDEVTNHVLERCSPQTPYNPTYCNVPNDRKCSLKRLTGSKSKINLKYESSMDNISQHLTDLDINEQSTLLRGYSSASTSTIPLPQSVSSNLNDSLDSFSESSHKTGKTAAENFRNEVANRRRAKEAKCCNNNNINNNHHGRQHRHHKHRISLCCRVDDNCYISDSPNESRPKSCHVPSKILEIKSRPRCGKFSSTESMTTSSSGGSLESIRSSTSEGNRSTTSTDSHHSSSLSSHSSDSAVGNGYHYPVSLQLGNRFLNQNKMHVLSPISDKSFQEPCSESSEINRNNSQKVSPEEKCASPSETQWTEHKAKRRLPQNKNVVNLSLPFVNNAPSGDLETHHGSDSGISIESRSDNNKVLQTTDLNDLPFDMPKLRRRRLQQMQLTQSSTQDTSSSATSVDLKDLPFDMPKLRRKLRSSSTQESVELPLEMKNSLSIASLTNEDQSGKMVVWFVFTKKNKKISE